MKYAVISVSAEGARLGQRVIKELSGNGTAYERYGAESGEPATYFHRTMELVTTIFPQYEGLLFIMASGIAVRAIAPYIVSKASDPAVLVMDECGFHCIALLSGHLGGANAWARKVAAACGADPVITTATDVHQRRAPDDLARMLQMKVEPLDALKPVNSVIAAGKPFGWLLDPDTEGAADIMARAASCGVQLASTKEANSIPFDAAAVISEKKIELFVPHVYLRPRNLYVGIGCKRGIQEDKIREALQAALQSVKSHAYQIAALASVTVKADEKGLLDLAAHIDRPIRFYTPEELEQCITLRHLEESEFVKKTIGVGNVCEAAALLAAKKGKILLSKTRYHGVTISVVAGLSG